MLHLFYPGYGCGSGAYPGNNGQESGILFLKAHEFSSILNPKLHYICVCADAFDTVFE